VAETQSAFRQSLPVLITSLVNKTGAIGISLLPMLLVEGQYSTAQSSFAMSVVKGSTIAATLLSGWFSDALGLRIVVLGSLLFAAVGLVFLPIQLGFVVLLVSGVVAQLGIASINASMRLLLTRTVERSRQKEALGWMRFVNNLGQIFSFGLATMSATLGARVLIWFDAFTSLASFVIGRKVLPREVRTEEAVPGAQQAIGNRGGWNAWWPFIGCTLLLTGWNFIYEFFMAGMAGKLKVFHPTEGLRIFSILMVVNTILCAALAVTASRILTRAVPSLIIAAVLMTGGLILGVRSVQSIPLLLVSMLLLTMGEIVYGALGQFLMIRAVPRSNRENTVYASAILIANCGRMLAAGLAFPMIVRAEDSRPATMVAAAVGALSVLVLAMGRKNFTRLASE